MTSFSVPALLGAAALLSLPLVSARADDAVPITVSGFNDDAVQSLTSTTGVGGLGGYAFFDAAFSAAHPTTTSLAGAFPTGSAVGNSGNLYDFAPATGYDALHGAGTLTFVSPVGDFTTLYVLGASANGPTTFNYTLTFKNSTATVTGSLYFYDWAFNNSHYDISGLGRETGGSEDGYGNIFGLSDPSIAIPVADQGLVLNSLQLTTVSGGETALFAVSGIPAIPEPTTCAMLLLGGAALLAIRRRVA